VSCSEIAVGIYANRGIERDESVIAVSLSMARSEEASLGNAHVKIARERREPLIRAFHLGRNLSWAHRISQLVFIRESLLQLRPHVNPRMLDLFL